jgi:hypothetical protein
VDLTKPDRLFPEKFAPASPKDLAEFEERLLTAVAHVLEEPANRAAIGARSPEMVSLIDDVVADWAAVVLANERSEPEDTRTQLRAVAQFSSETLGELVQGMTWTEAAGPISARVKLSQQGSHWTFVFAYKDPRTGAMETVTGASFPAKREAGLRAASAVWETAAKLHDERPAGGAS